MHHLVLYVEVELARQESLEVLVDEVIARVLRDILLEVLAEDRPLLLLLRWSERKDIVLDEELLLTKGNRDLFLRVLDEIGLLRPLLELKILEVDDELAVHVFEDRLRQTRGAFFILDVRRLIGIPEDEAPDRVIVLDVVLRCFGRHQLEAHPRAVVELERIVLEILAALDVVLVGVRPMKLHLLARIRNRVDAVLVAALRNEVARVIVAAEKIKEMRIDARLGIFVDANRRDFRLKLLDFRQNIRIGTQRFRLRDRIVQLLLENRLLRRRIPGQRRLYLLGETRFKERVDLLRARMDDAVDAKVKFGLVELEDLLQLGTQFVKLRHSLLKSHAT